MSSCLLCQPAFPSDVSAALPAMHVLPLSPCLGAALRHTVAAMAGVRAPIPLQGLWVVHSTVAIPRGTKQGAPKGECFHQIHSQFFPAVHPVTLCMSFSLPLPLSQVLTINSSTVCVECCVRCPFPTAVVIAIDIVTATAGGDRCCIALDGGNEDLRGNGCGCCCRCHTDHAASARVFEPRIAGNHAARHFVLRLRPLSFNVRIRGVVSTMREREKGRERVCVCVFVSKKPRERGGVGLTSRSRCREVERSWVCAFVCTKRLSRDRERAQTFFEQHAILEFPWGRTSTPFCAAAPFAHRLPCLLPAQVASCYRFRCRCHCRCHYHFHQYQAHLVWTGVSLPAAHCMCSKDQVWALQPCWKPGIARR